MEYHEMTDEQQWEFDKRLENHPLVKMFNENGIFCSFSADFIDDKLSKVVEIADQYANERVKELEDHLLYVWNLQEDIKERLRPVINEIRSENQNPIKNNRIDVFKEVSQPLPTILYDNADPNNVIDNFRISGMVCNNGIPTEFSMYKCVKGEEIEKLVYRLV
jgi:hypothetical protein